MSKTKHDPVIAGVDEAGRGPLAGPVSVAAVIVNPDRPIIGLNDSKKLTARRRELLFDIICDRALAWEIVHIEMAIIDHINILQATLLGMQKAVAGLRLKPELVLVDGNRCPDFGIPANAIIGGDATQAAISAASILAKVSRDRYMLKQHQRWPQYGFDKNKGYPTAMHRAALEKHGVCPIHRRSFAPVARVLETNSI
ncbi:MAG: ribonuclease HII [Xanthomonadales bacterium]|nr:ribonuclease HII [Xanthomonadales bacterium]